MNAEQAFVRRVLENPADDAVRLVYADWLEETGRPWNVARAHFIRRQIGRHSDPHRTASSVSPLLAADERDLRAWWSKWLPACARKSWTSYRQNLMGDTVQVRERTAAVRVRSERVGFQRAGVGRRGWTEEYTFERGFLTFVRVTSATPAAHVGPVVELVAGCLRAAPVAEFVITVAGFEPWVRFAVQPWDDGRWQSVLYTDWTLDESRRVTDLDDLIDGHTYADRRDLVREAHLVLARHLPAVRFDLRPGEAEELEYEELDEPDPDEV